jgi:alpha-mannosidase
MAKKETKHYDIHVISQTHWDREWRYSFQKNRMYLVDMLDDLLNILENNPEYKHYHLDSQTIPLEDYLAIRPENKERMKKLVQEGRLLIGPWYCLPDEFLISGESLVRNLLWGHRTAREFGEPMKVGYTPFSWGQISQLPQVYAGFGIDNILFYRGVSSLEAPKAEFIWEGADGTKSLASRFASWPRYNFWYFVYRKVLYGRESYERDYRWTEGGLPFKVCDQWAGIDADYEMLDTKDIFHHEIVKQCCDELVEMQKDDFSTNQLVWMNGHDSSAPHAMEPQLIKECQEARPNDKVTHSSLPEYIESLKKTVKDLVTIKGEMRYGYRTPSISVLYGYVTSARMYLKQLNTATERKLQNYAEPFASINWLLGDEYPQGFLNMSWKWLMENHGHDAIGGCSVDGVHEDMVFRYKQSSEISQNVLYKSFQKIVRKIDTSKKADDSIFLIVFNPLPFKRDELISPQIDIPVSFPWKSIVVKDLSVGKEVPIQFQDMQATYPVMQTMKDTPMMFQVKRVSCHFLAENLPSLGYKVYEVIRKDKIKRNFGSLSPEFGVLENEYLKAAINANGSINLTDKVTGNEFKGLHYFEDRGESGSPWVTKPPYFDQVFNTLSQNAQIILTESGPFKTAYTVKWVMELPESLNADGTRRSDVTKPVEIRSIVTLKKGCKHLDFETHINNTVEYHRLRVCFPSDVKSQVNYADGQFDVIQRAIENPDDSEWNEPLMKDKPQNNFVDVPSAQRSLAVFNDGIKEYEVMDDLHKTIALTLIRSFSIKIDLLGEGGVDYREQMKGSQCLGPQVYRYAIYPHKGNWDKAIVMKEALGFNHPSRIVQCGKATHKGNLPATETTFLSIPDGSVMSALKLAEDKTALVLRLYNPSEKSIKGDIQFVKPIKSAATTDLEENVLSAIKVNAKGTISVEIKPKKIVTLKIGF